MALDNNFYDFSAGNSLKDIKILNTEMSKLLNISKNVAKEINKISNIKININLNTKDIEKNIDDVSDSLKSLNADIVDTISKTNGAFSKIDNNMSSRVKGKGDFSKLKELAASYSVKFMDAILPSDQSNMISGALQGFTAGIATGNPIVAVATTIIGAGAEWALSEIKENTDRRNQRVGFASNLLKTYLPKIAMSSLNYAADMEQSEINYHNILGKDKGSMFIDNMLNLSNKGFYEYSDLDNIGKQMIAAGFDNKEIIKIFDTVGDASVANGAGKQGALQMLEAIKTMQSTGNVSIENLEIFKNFGVDAYGILADSMKIAGKNTKLTNDELKELISKGVVPADKAIDNLVNGMKYKYAGMMYTYEQSFSGLIASIKDSANQIILGPLGRGFIEGIKPALSGFSEFFGLGTKGFKDLSENIYNFGAEIGKFAGSAINNLKNIFSQLFDDEKFKNADIPEKILMIYDQIKVNVDKWYEDNGASLFEKINKFFKDFIIKIGEDSEFKKAVQDLWLTISPDADTIKKMFQKSILSTPVLPSIGPGIQLSVDLSSKLASKLVSKSNAIGLNRVPYDYYPALLHEGEAVLRRTEADNYRNGVGKGVIISKIADTIVVKDETDMYKLADILVSEIEKAGLVYGGAM